MLFSGIGVCKPTHCQRLYKDFVPAFLSFLQLIFVVVFQLDLTPVLWLNYLVTICLREYNRRIPFKRNSLVFIRVIQIIFTQLHIASLQTNRIWNG